MVAGAAVKAYRMEDGALSSAEPVAPVDATRPLRPQVEEALAELVTLGLANSDSFGGLRALLRRPIDGRVTVLRRPSVASLRHPVPLVCAGLQ